MFSSKELLSFVFANENDTYYGDDLLKRNLNQYLWEQLHTKYAAVYFLSAEDNCFLVRSFGDRCCSEFTPGKKLFGLFGSGAIQKDFGSWLQKQLRARPGEAAAFVCPLEDFCTVFSDSRWDPVLSAIAEDKKRTGIFVLTASATAERTTKLLLESNVFRKLQDSAVIRLLTDADLELYEQLKNQKLDSCLFLNVLSFQQLQGLLLHLIMEHPERFDCCDQLDILTEYLYTIVHDPELYAREALFPWDLPPAYLMYADLYEQLYNDRIWNRFVEHAEAFVISNPLGSHKLPAGNRVPILRDRNSYAGRCIRLRLPAWLQKKADTRVRAENLLCEIRRAVSAPMNKLENPDIISAADRFLNQLDAVNSGDAGSYIHILNSLRFCVDHVYTKPEQEKTADILKVIDMQHKAITVFEHCFKLRRDLEPYQDSSDEGQLQSVICRQLRDDLSVSEKLRKKYIDLIQTQKLRLTMSFDTSDVLNDLEKEIDTLIHPEKESDHVDSKSVPSSDSQDDDFDDALMHQFIYMPTI